MLAWPHGKGAKLWHIAAGRDPDRGNKQGRVRLTVCGLRCALAEDHPGSERWPNCPECRAI